MSKSRVVKIRNRKIYKSGDKLDFGEIQRLVNYSLKRLTDSADFISAWRIIAEKGRTFGIKANCLGGRFLSSSPEIAGAIAEGLKSAGINESDIIIWDRTNRELERAGFKLNYAQSGLKCFGTDSNGVGYGSRFHQNGQVASLMSKIFEDMVDANINFPILKDHSIAGISGGLKNNYGLVHNPNKYHPDNCNPYAADLAALPIVRKKNILTVMDMTKIQYNGGPGYVSQYFEKPGCLMVAFDPIAIDSCACRIIDDYRIKNGLRNLKDSGREPYWIKTGNKLGLGEMDFDKIEFVEEDIS